MLPNNNPIVSFPSAQAWENWLDVHHPTCAGVWLQIAKKGASSPSVTYAEALETALCYGWIDGHKRPQDAQYWLQRFVPRAPRSIWSQINREKALALIDQGRMKPAGQDAIERAKQNGRWDAAYESSSRAVVPADLQTVLDTNPEAKAFFESLDSANRYAVLFRVQNVKKAETRARKIVHFVEMLARKEKVYP